MNGVDPFSSNRYSLFGKKPSLSDDLTIRASMMTWKRSSWPLRGIFCTGIGIGFYSAACELIELKKYYDLFHSYNFVSGRVSNFKIKIKSVASFYFKSKKEQIGYVLQRFRYEVLFYRLHDALKKEGQCRSVFLSFSSSDRQVVLERLFILRYSALGDNGEKDKARQVLGEILIVDKDLDVDSLRLIRNFFVATERFAVDMRGFFKELLRSGLLQEKQMVLFGVHALFYQTEKARIISNVISTPFDGKKIHSQIEPLYGYVFQHLVQSKVLSASQVDLIVSKIVVSEEFERLRKEGRKPNQERLAGCIERTLSFAPNEPFFKIKRATECLKQETVLSVFVNDPETDNLLKALRLKQTIVRLTYEKKS
jgi:hypothetical protein